MAISAALQEQHKALFDLARSKKYITYQEINQCLSADVVAADAIDEILTIVMAECNAELVASEKKIPSSTLR